MILICLFLTVVDCNLTKRNLTKRNLINEKDLFTSYLRKKKCNPADWAGCTFSCLGYYLLLLLSVDCSKTVGCSRIKNSSNFHAFSFWHPEFSYGYEG